MPSTQLIRKELVWEEASSLLYDPLCSNKSTECSRLLRGTLSSGIQVSIVEFSYQVIMLHSMVSANYSSQRSFILRSVS